MERDPRGRQYHQVGTGRTRSDYWCSVCDGWYGVPHNDFDHSRDRRHVDSCCCGACLTVERRYHEGTTMTHRDYLDLWEGTPEEDRWKIPYLERSR